MRFTPEVVAALEVLRSACENDFERHRLDVLERDLTAPPQIEIIDERHVKFDDLIYHKDKTNHFVATNGLHRRIWQYHNGEIPQGCEIHHRDLNPLNNSIDNLECLTASEHMRLHAPDKIKFRRKEIFTCQQCGKQSHIAAKSSLTERRKLNIVQGKAPVSRGVRMTSKPVRPAANNSLAANAILKSFVLLNVVTNARIDRNPLTEPSKEFALYALARSLLANIAEPKPVRPNAPMKSDASLSKFATKLKPNIKKACGGTASGLRNRHCQNHQRFLSAL